jgi:AcrR family transcriptional regulator
MTSTQRKRDAAGTRVALLDAARRLMAERGVHGASTRDVAAAAGVNQALVYRYFGSKEKLFAEAAGRGVSESGIETMTDTPLADLPRRLLEGALDNGDSTAPQDDLLAVLTGGLDDESVRAVMRGRVDRVFGDVLAARLDGPDAALRAELLAALLAGVTLMREKVGTQALAAADRDAIGAQVDRLAAVLFHPGD